MCPDFPKPPGAGVTAAEVWAYSTRGLTGDAANAIRDAILSDATKIPGANVDTAISGRAPASEYDTEMARITAPVATESKQDVIDGVVDDVKLKTENLPASPAPSGEYDTELDTPVSTRAAITDYTAARAAKIDKVQNFIEDALGTLTATGSEDEIRESLAEGKLHAFIDLTAMVASDSITVRQYIKVKAAGSYIKYAEETFADVQSLPMLYVVTKPSKHGIRITLEQTAGTYRDFDWETFIEQAA